MKKAVTSAVLAVAIALSCCSCMSTDEQSKAMEDVKAAKPIVDNYLAEHYSGAYVSTIEYLAKYKSSSPVPDFGIYASGCCIAEIENGENDFEVIVDTDSGKCWDNMHIGSTKQEIKDKLCALIGGGMPADIELNLFPAELVGTVASNFEGYTDTSGRNADAILNGGGYYINAVMKYDCRLDTLSLEQLLGQKYKSMVNIQLVKYRDSTNNNMDILPNDKTGTNLRYTEEMQYLMFEQYEMIKSKPNENDDCYVFEEPVLSEFSAQQLGDMIFAWNSSHIDVEISEVEAPSPVSTQYYSGADFYKLEDTAAELKYSCKTELSSNLYFYTANEYSKAFLIGVVNGSGKDIAQSISIFTKSEKYYHKTLRGCKFSLKDSGSTILGIYKKGMY